MKKLLLLLVFAAVSFGQTLDPSLPPDADSAIASAVDFEGSITLGVSDLVSTVAPSLMPFGWTLLGLFGVFALVQTLLQANLRAISMHHYNPLATVVAYVAILFRITIAATMLTFYLRSIPGLSINFHQIFPYLGQALANGITTDLVKQVMVVFNTLSHKLPATSMFQVLPAILTVIVLGLITLAELGMTVITLASYVIVGFLVLCGPIMIPFYVLPGQDKKFWNWLDNLISYSMLVFSSAAIVFIFCHAYLDFFGNVHSYSVAQWLVMSRLLGLITIAFVYVMFKVPAINQMVFGGTGNVVQGFAGAVQGLAVRAVAGAFL